MLLVGAVLALGASGGGAWYWFRGTGQARVDLITHTVRLDPLQLTIVERGQMESAENSDVFCRVKAGSKGSTIASTIKWLIDDGSHVIKGQPICELDDSGLQEQLKSQKILVDQARAAWISAEENYKIVDSQNLSDIKNAETTVQLADLDLRKYIEGEYEATKKEILGRKSICESNLVLWDDRSAWSDRMVKKGYVTTSAAQGDRSRRDSARIDLEKVKEELRVLEQYTFPRQKTDLESKVAESRRSLERVKTQATSKEKTAESERVSKKSIYEQEGNKYMEIEDEIRKCNITALQEGMVVYFQSEQSRYGSGSQQSIVAQGEPVREGQKLMRIPDLNRMQVNTRVHEAMVSRVRGEISRPTGFGDCVRAALLTAPDAVARLVSVFTFAELRDHFKDKEQQLIYGGQSAFIKVDAFPDRQLRGHVRSVATVAAQSDFMSSDVKVYTTIVSVDEPVENLKPGMSAEVTIMVDTRVEPVLQVPTQAILGSPAMGQQRKVYVLLAEGATEERLVTVGRSNTRMAEIKEGIQEGDEVIINPRVLLTDREKGKLGTGAEKGVAPGGGNGKSAGEGKGGDKSGKGGGKRGGRGGGGDGFPGGPEGGFPGGGPGGRGGPPQ